MLHNKKKIQYNTRKPKNVERLMMVKLLQNKKTKKQKFTTKSNYGKTKDVVPNI